MIAQIVFDNTVTLGNVLTVATMAIGIVAAFFRFSIQHAQLLIRMDRLEKDLARQGMAIEKVAVLQEQQAQNHHRFDALERRMERLEANT